MYTILGKASYILPFPSLGKDTLYWLYVRRLCTQYNYSRLYT